MIYRCVYPFALVVLTAVPCLAGGGEDGEEPSGFTPEQRAWIEAHTKELLEAQRAEFEKKLDAARAAGSDASLEAEVEEYLNEGEKSVPPAAPRTASGALRLIDVSFSGLFVAGTSTAPDSRLGELFFGDHDPRGRGFSAPNEEIVLSGVVDPYFRGDVNIVYSITAEGESNVELEEAYLTTLSLPAGLQAKVGTFFNAFGRQNAMHPHAWNFLDQPVVLGRMFGPDGLRGPGAQLSWLTPLPFYAELIGGVQNANGETAFSFFGEEGEFFGGRPLERRGVRSLADLVYLIRLKTSFDPTDEWTLVPGISALFGPNGTGDGRRTTILGFDLYAKWKPRDNDHGFPFVAVQSEVLWRDYEAAAFVPESGPALPAETLRDGGTYLEVLWGFKRPWVVGGRFEYAHGWGGPGADFLRDRRLRYSVNLTYYLSEFSKVRLQFNLDDTEMLPHTVSSIFVQFEILFGAHGAHKF